MKTTSRLRSFLILTGSSLLAISSASAETWVPTATGASYNWQTTSNWSPTTVPNASGATANLNIDIAGGQTINLNAAVTVGSLSFGDTGGTFVAQNIAGGTGGSLIFNNGGSGATLTHSASTFGDLISANITLNDNLTMVNNGTIADRNNAVQLTGIISGTGGITINAGGNGAFYLANGGNTYSGGVTLNHSSAKIVAYTNGDAFGTGTITINAGTVDTSSPGGAALLLTTSNANVWNGNWNSANFWNNNGNVTLGNNITVTRNNHLSLGGNIGDGGSNRSLTLSSAASSVFNGTNTYTGGTTVPAGSLNFLKTASMPSTGAVSFTTGATLGIGIGGSGWTSTGTGVGTLAGVFQGTNIGVGPGSSTFSYGASVGLNLIVTGNHSFGAIENLGSGATAYTQYGLGTLTITGDNTYTGATALHGGGGLVLDYGSSNTSKFASAAGLTLGGSANTSIGLYGGGTITVKGGTFTEVVSATSLNAGHTTIARDGGTTSKLRLNAITRAAGGSISFADATIADTDRTNTNGIIGGYATLGNDWATSAASGTDIAITALAAYDGALPTTVGDATKNYTLSGNVSIGAGGTAANTIKITDTGANEILTLGANNLTITSASATALGGIMYAGGTSGSYTINGGGAGRLGTSVAGQELIFAVQSGTLTVNAIFAGSNPITKTGAGTMVIGATNTGNGNYYINEGVLRLNNAAASGAAGSFNGLATFVQNGAALELGGFTFTDGERLMLTGSGISNGGALRAITGTNIWRGLIEIGLGGARINNDSAGLLTISNGITTVSGGDITFGGVGNVTVTTPTVTTYGRQAINGGGGLIKDGAGTLTLSASNYVGGTTVLAGTLALGDASNTLYDTGALTVNGGTAILSIGANSDTVGAVSLKGSGQINGSGGTLTGSSYAFESGSVSAKLGGAGVALTKTTGGIVTLSGANSYTGGTLINQGTLLVNNSSGSGTGTGAVSVAASATLGGNGTVGGATTFTGASIHAPGSAAATVGTQTFSSSLTYGNGTIFNWDLDTLAGGNVTDPGVVNNAATGTYDRVTATGAITATGSGDAVFRIVLAVGDSFADAFWNTDKSWTNIFTGGSGSAANLDALFNGFEASGGLDAAGVVTGRGQFTLSTTANTLSWTAVPEPTSALVGLLIGAGLLRRRRA